MRWLALVLCLVGFSRARAAVTFEIDPLNVQTRFERPEEQGVQARTSLSWAIGASWDVFGVLAEYGTSSTRSGTAYANFGREHDEFILWGRGEHFLGSHVSAVGGLGLGFAQDSVDTHFGDDRLRDQGERQTLYGVSAGLAYDPIELIRLAFEGRLFFSDGFDPNPQPDLIFRAGFRF